VLVTTRRHYSVSNCHGPYLPMSEAIAAVVFDLDGVLIDSESVWDAARRTAGAGKPTRRGR
jgi:hypothetical protein